MVYYNPRWPCSPVENSSWAWAFHIMQKQNKTSLVTSDCFNYCKWH